MFIQISNLTMSTPQPEQPQIVGQTPAGEPDHQTVLNDDNIDDILASLGEGIEPEDEEIVKAPEPCFTYSGIDIDNFSSNYRHVLLPDKACSRAFQRFDDTVVNTIEHIINEVNEQIMECSITPAVATTSRIGKNNYAQDPDENRMKASAHQMVRRLTSGIALAIFSHQFPELLMGNLRRAFDHGVAVGLSAIEIAAVARQLCSDNLEMAISFIQKVAAEKATYVVDGKLTDEFMVRKEARDEGRSYCEPQAFICQVERIPEQICLKVGGSSSTQSTEDEELARYIPGFQQMPEGNIAKFLNKPQQLPDTSIDPKKLNFLYEVLFNKMISFLNDTLNIPALQEQANKMHALLKALMIAHQIKDNKSASNVLSRMVVGFVQGIANIPGHLEKIKDYRDVNLCMLLLLENICGVGVAERAIEEAMAGASGDDHCNKETMKLLIPSYFKKRLGIE